MRSLTRAGVAGVDAQLPLGVGLLQHLEVPGTFGDRRVGLVALEREVPHASQHPLFDPNERYTVFAATPASRAIAATVVAA